MLTLIRKRAGLVLAGLVAVLCPMFMAPSGGFPSNPTFQSVAISNTTAAQNFSQLVMNATTSGVASYMTFNNQGVQKGILLNERTAGSNCAGDAQDDVCLRSVSGRVYIVDNRSSGPVGFAPFICSTACNIASIAAGQSAVIYKSGTTSRASSTALTVDPDLQFTNAPAGSYSLVYNLDWTTGAGGYNYEISFTGGGAGFTTGTNLCSAVATNAVAATAGGSPVTCATSSGGQSGGQAVVNSGAAATIGVYWSQNSSNVANSSLTGPSSVVLTRVL